MTSNPNHLDAIANAEAALTPQVIAARKAALDAKNRATWAGWASADSTIAALVTQIATETGLLAAAQTSLTTDQAAQTSKTTLIAQNDAQIANLQAQIAAGGPPADPADVAERDEVVLLAGEVGVTW